MTYDLIVVGAGIGGLSAAALMAQAGKRVLVLEANYLPGGCASSYPVKRDNETFWLETGATTLVGKDLNQPLKILEEALQIKLPGEEINPSMKIHIDGLSVIRYKDQSQWIEECYQQFFGLTGVQKKQVAGFWNEIFELADFVWAVSGKNKAFPPANLLDLFRLLKSNSLTDIPKLRFLLRPIIARIQHYGLHESKAFIRFCNEQLRITAQSDVRATSSLYASPCLAYTNTSNYYVYGGMIELSNALIHKMKADNAEIRFRTQVRSIDYTSDGFKVQTEENETFNAKKLISNATIWNMAEITSGKMKAYFRKMSNTYSFAWGAFTMGIVLKNVINPASPLHHQILIPNPIPHIHSDSIFVSFSKPDDQKRHPEGYQILSVSTHVKPELWLNNPEMYDKMKDETASAILNLLGKTFEGFDTQDILIQHTSTPRTWQRWIQRYMGRVGGIPEAFSGIPVFVPQVRTPFKGLFLAGDSVYPGQGIAGVSLSGQMAAFYAHKQK
jgi:C-3',4' desaturase CrtD